MAIGQALSGEGAHRRIKTTKTAKGTRIIALGPRLMAILAAHRQTQQVLCEAAGPKWEESGLVFTTVHGKFLSEVNIDRVFKKALVRAGLPDDIRVHDLRHAMATQWLAAGVSPHIVSERLGHTSVAFTLQTYGHVLPHQQGNAAGPMEAQIFGDSIPTTSPRAQKNEINGEIVDDGRN